LDNKGFGEILLIMGIALLLIGIGVGIYSEVLSGSTYAITIPANTVPAWFAIVIAVTIAILGIVLIVLGAKELGILRRWLLDP
jgi:hypothetical protein